MRVDQVITLVWVGNVALLGATGWVGWKFWQQKKARTQVAQVAWPDADAKDPVAQKWPGPLKDFKHLWETHLSGLVPPPPKPVEDVKRQPDDLRTLFRNRVKIESAFGGSAPAVVIKDQQSNSQRLMVLGEKFDEWQLVAISQDAGGLIHATFRHPNDPQGPFELVSDKPVIPPVAEHGHRPFEPTLDGGFARPGTVDPKKVEPQAWVDPATGEWQVPFEEQVWWMEFSDAEILKKTIFASRPEGLEIASQPPRAALDDTRGISKGDILVSINGVPVKTIEEVQAYFRGEGKGKARFVVVVLRDGRQRTQVYNLRPARAH